MARSWQASPRRPRWPAHAPAAQHVQVDVVHRLPGVRPGVGDQPVPRLVGAVTEQPLLPGRVGGAGDHLAEQSRVGGGERADGRVVLLGDHEDVRGRLGVDVAEGEHPVGVEDDVGGIAVHIAARVGALAGGGEVLVTSTVKDLVAGSGIVFADRGAQQLKGIPDEWRLFAATAGESA